jgi:hypothetical protein
MNKIYVSINVMQWELSTFCAGSCPVAIKSAVTKLDAWALNPPNIIDISMQLYIYGMSPMDPAIADPIKFLFIFKSTRSFTVVFNTL